MRKIILYTLALCLVSTGVLSEVEENPSGKERKIKRTMEQRSLMMTDKVYDRAVKEAGKNKRSKTMEYTRVFHDRRKPKKRSAEDRVIVKFKKDKDNRGNRKKIKDKHKLQSHKHLEKTNLRVYKLPKEKIKDKQKVIAELKKKPDVDYAEGDVILEALRYSYTSSRGYASDAVACIEYAVAKGADIINVSWGSTGYSQAVYNALDMAREAGILVVAAAGDSRENNDLVPMYPASYDLDNILSVTATDHNDQLAWFSNTGPGGQDFLRRPHRCFRRHEPVVRGSTCHYPAGGRLFRFRRHNRTSAVG